MRELVTGGAACAVPGSSLSNPLAALANTFIGSSSQKESLQEIPTSSLNTSGNNFYSGAREPLSALPGSELDHPLQHESKGSEFISSFHASNDNRLAAVWDGIQNPQIPHFPAREGQANFPLGPRRLQPELKGPPQRALSSLLRSFVNSSHGGVPFGATQLPVLGLSEGDKWCIRDRSSIMARNIFADKSEDFINGQEKAQMKAVDQMAGSNIPSVAAMEQTCMLAQTLAQNRNPKFQKSKFLKFVSKMSRGELTIEDNQVKLASGDWANEYQQQYNASPFSRADQYAHEELSSGPDKWADEFATEPVYHGLTDEQWVNAFSEIRGDDWADEFRYQFGEENLGDDSADNWESAYEKYLNEQAVTSKGVYVFSDLNPYVGHPNPPIEGQELFHKGLLSEAVLALEAEVLKNPHNAEGWRLLGVAHAENGDDQQAIASMMRAHEADPTNLEVRLALGVSLANESEQQSALKYLYSWLRHHPRYGKIAPLELSDSLYCADVAQTFNEAAQMSPEDADVHIVLGVLYILSSEYDKAIEYFKTALKLNPRDYSLWNKLGATQANNNQSDDAVYAYQQALDLKPSYVRAWVNLAISYANQGMCEDAIPYYVRALAMNPNEDKTWQYLKISLSYVSRDDMLEACDSRNLDVLQEEFPL